MKRSQKKKIKTIISAESTFDTVAFEQGRKASRKYRRTRRKRNPYPKETNEWYNWNRGFNEEL